MSIVCKWTRPFWGIDCWRWPKSLSLAQAASLCSACIERTQKCLQGVCVCAHFVRCCQSTQYPQSAFQGVFRGLPGGGGGSAAACDPNPPRPFARYRPFSTSKQEVVVCCSLGIARKCLGIPWTEKWPKTGHANDWVYCDWQDWGLRCAPPDL